MSIVNVVSLREGSQKEFEEYKKHVEKYIDKIYIAGTKEYAENNLSENDWILFSDIYMRFTETFLKKLKELVLNPQISLYSATVHTCSQSGEYYIKGKERTDIIFASMKIPLEVHLEEGICRAKFDQIFQRNVMHLKDGVYDLFSESGEEPGELLAKIPYEKRLGLSDRKRVLMTNLYIQKYTGSELHTLSMAKQFVKKGYEVVIAVFAKAYPLLEIFEEIPEIHIIDCLENKLPFTHYDIFFAQHYAVADWVILNNHITCDRLIVSRLGIYTRLEALPCFAREADVVCCVSREIEERIISEIGNDVQIQKIENCVDEEYFEQFNSNKTSQLQSVAVISNHIGQDVLDAAEELRRKGVTVDLYGEQFKAVLVTPELLEPYDVVITIGKTVQYALACGVLPYVYDFFGGPGYLSDENFEAARKYNFSGRDCQKRKNGNELAEDIISGFEAAFTKRIQWNKKAAIWYNMNRKFDEFFNMLMEKPVKYRKMEEFYSTLEKECTLRYGEGVKGTLGIQNAKAKVYFDIGDGMNEIFTEEYEYVLGQSIRLSVPVVETVRQIRFDPMESMGECQIESVTLLNSKREIACIPINGVREEQKDVFLTCDPQYIIQVSGENDILVINFMASVFREQEIEAYYNKAWQKLCLAENELEHIKSTKIWKIREQLKKIL